MGLLALFTRGTSVYTIAVEDEKETAMARISGWTLCFSTSLSPGFRCLRSSRLWRSVPNALRLVEPKGSHQSSLFPHKQKSPLKAGCFVYGGEGGIRTLDTLLTYTPLAGERLQPLGHFSGIWYQKRASSNGRCFSGHPALFLPAKTSFRGGAMLPHLIRLLGESLTP